MNRRRKWDLWTSLALCLLALLTLFFIYPCVRLLWEAFYVEGTGFTMKAFIKFFSKKFYYKTILNSFKVSAAVMAVEMVSRSRISPTRITSGS